MRESVPAFGTTLIGIGLGVAYLSLYAGHFQLHVLSTRTAFASLAIVSIAGIVAGLHYRVAAIATLGVIGAFIPPVASTWLELTSFRPLAGALVGYFAFVNLAVVVLTTGRNWRPLNLLSLGLTLLAWLVAVGNGPWSLGTELGLLALFTLLGLAPLPRIVRQDVSPDPYDLGITLAAPMAMLIASWPYLAITPPRVVAVLMLALSLAHVLAAFALGLGTPRRLLWRAHTAWASLFLTAGLERWLGSTWTPLAWAIEGVLLVVLGLTPGGGWLRALGYAIGAASAIVSLPAFLTGITWTLGSGEFLLVPNSVRALVIVVAYLATAWLLHRVRDRLAEGEVRLAPELWTAVGNFFLAAWMVPHASRLAGLFPRTDGGWFGAILAFAWTLQATILIALGLRRGSFLRVLGFVLAAVGGCVLLFGPIMEGRSEEDPLLLLHPTGLLRLAAIGLLFALAFHAARVREEEPERGIAQGEPDALTVMGHLLLAVLLETEGRPVAGALGFARETGFAPMFTAAAWLAQSLFLVALGQSARSLTLRGFGYLGAIVSTLAALPAALLISSGDASLPFVHPAGPLELGLLIGLIACAELLARARESLTQEEQPVPEIVTLLATFLWLVLSVVEAGPLAKYLNPTDADSVRAGLASAGWLIAAIVHFTLGWTRGSTFLRRLGLALFGLTVVKFLAYDLTQVDTFWRFVVAIAAGAALLTVSYVYQRARRSERTGR
jgi:uncharacterized membrane protein